MSHSAQDILLVDSITEQKRVVSKHDVLLEDFRELGSLVIESFPPSILRTDALRVLLVASMLAYDAIWNSYGLFNAKIDDRSQALEDLILKLSPRFIDDPTDIENQTEVGRLSFKQAVLASKIGSCMYVPDARADSCFATPGFFGCLIKEDRLDALRKLNEFDKFLDLLIKRHIKNTGHQVSC